MRSYQEFKNIWLGEECRDGQCVALIREYTEGFHDTPVLERLGIDGGAEGLFTRYETDVGPVSRNVFERIHYTQGSTLRPEPGDIVVFGPSSTNKWGHVGIMDSENGNCIFILDQNGIAAMRGETVKVKLSIWTMERVLGWLRFRRKDASSESK